MGKFEVVSRILSGATLGVIEGAVLIMVPTFLAETLKTYIRGLLVEEGALVLPIHPFTTIHLTVFVALKVVSRLLRETALEPAVSTFSYLYVLAVLYSVLNGGVIESSIELEEFKVWIRLDFSSALVIVLAFLILLPAIASVGEFVYKISKIKLTRG